MTWTCAGTASCDGDVQRAVGALRPFLGALVALLCLAAGPVQAEVLVTDISFSARSDGAGFVVRAHTTGPAEGYGKWRVGSHQLEWVLYNTALHDDFEKNAPEGPVKRYTTSRRNGHLVIRFRFAEDRSLTASTYRDGASDDLLLNLVYDDSNPVTASSSASGSESDETGRSGSASEASSAPSASSSGGGTVPNPASQMSRRRSRLDTVVIDPGHGGKDPGAVAQGLLEKDIVLDVAHKLGDYIENRLGIEVAYTRTGDEFIPLEERGHFANQVGGDLFISLHANSAPSAPSARGTETYFLGRAKTDAARKVMRRENSVVRQYEANPDRYDKYDGEAFVKGELFLSASMQFSEQIASLVQHQFEHRVHRRNRGVRQAGFYVLWSASMPAVLVELGFMTNAREARFLSSDRGQTYLASAIFRAVRTYEKDYNKGIVASE